MIDCDSSVEPKSTMINSKSRNVWLRMLSIASGKKRSTLHTTMATETRGVSMCRDSNLDGFTTEITENTEALLLCRLCGLCVLCGECSYMVPLTKRRTPSFSTRTLKLINKASLHPDSLRYDMT